MTDRRWILLVGDNPFHGVSHLSQERARQRGDEITLPEKASRLVMTALDSGADGFMFSVSDTTLSILQHIFRSEDGERPELYPLVPYAYEYVRLATQAGGISGLGRRFARQLLSSFNFKAIAMGLKGAIRMDPAPLLEAYLGYEIQRLRASTDGKGNIRSIFLHEMITDMGLALNLEWLFKSYVDFLEGLRIRPGVETRNFAYLVDRFQEWNLDPEKALIATPFNRLGFQMNPSREPCERALGQMGARNVIAMSVLASGYLKPAEAAAYIKKLPNLTGIVVGVSKDKHASETFRLLREELI